MIALLIAMLASSQIEVDACRTAPPSCRQSAGEAILGERKLAALSDSHFQTCMEQLGARTSTAIQRIVIAPSSSTTPDAFSSLQTMIVVGAIVAVVFGALGYTLGASSQHDPQTVVVR